MSNRRATIDVLRSADVFASANTDCTAEFIGFLTGDMNEANAQKYSAVR